MRVFIYCAIFASLIFFNCNKKQKEADNTSTVAVAEHDSACCCCNPQITPRKCAYFSENDVCGEWGIEDSWAGITKIYSLDSIILGLSTNQIWIVARGVPDSVYCYKLNLFLVRPDDLGAGGMNYPWESFDKDFCIGALEFLNDSTMMSSWNGLYDKNEDTVYYGAYDWDSDDTIHKVINSGYIYLQTIMLQQLFPEEKITDDCNLHSSGKYGARSRKPHVHIKAENTMFTEHGLEEYAEQKTLLIQIDTIYECNVNNKNVSVAVLETVPPDFDCHPCAPSMGLAVFANDTNTGLKTILSRQDHLVNVGSMGSIEDGYELNVLDDNKIFLLIKQGATGQGFVEEQTTVFTHNSEWEFKEVLSQMTYHSNEGMCESASVPCEKDSCALSIIGITDSDKYGCVIERWKSINDEIQSETRDTVLFNTDK